MGGIMLRINITISLLLFSMLLFATENDKDESKDTTSIILLDENQSESTKTNNIKENEADLDNKTLEKDALVANEEKEIIVKKDDFKFECKYCKLDNSLAKTFEFGIHMGSPFGIDARFWITDF